METLSRWVLTYLVNAAWQVAMVAAAAGLADLLFRRAPSRYRHAVWFIALAVAALLPLRSLTEQGKVQEETPAPAQAPGAIASIAAHETSRNPLRVASQAPSGSQPLRREALLTFRHRWPLQVSLFLAHALLAFYMAFLLVRLRKFARAWRKTSTLRVRAFARELPEPVALIVARSPDAEILFSSSIALPVTLGALRPVILLPDRLVETMDSNELTAALLHEMAHVRRHDFLLNLLAEVLVLPLAFHPGGIFLKRRIDQTRELACDELSVASLESPATYARSLVSMARRSAAPVRAAAAAVDYTLGVQDADILEERVMKLLDKKPRLNARLARILLALAVTVLAAVSLSISAFSLNPVNTSKTRAPFDSVLHPNFSGTWKLDATKSNLPSPSPDHVVEVIDQRESQLTIKSESGDWPLKRPVAVALFPLLMPDFRATIDNSESVQSYGPGQLKSRTRWEGQNLLTEWKLEHEGQTVVEGTWLRALSQDEKTQTLELDARDPLSTGRGTAKLVFFKSAAQSSETKFPPGEDDGKLNAFGGTWMGRAQGKPFVILALRSEAGKLTGTISIGNMQGNAGGEVEAVIDEPNPRYAMQVIEAKVDGKKLSFKGRTASGKDNGFEMNLTGDRSAEIRFLSAPDAQPWKVQKESDVSAVSGGVGLGTGQGVGLGVVGGVTGGTVGGVTGGVPGGVVDGVKGEVTGSVSGVVTDPSGARVPGAIVSLSAKHKAFLQRMTTNQAGEYAFEGVPPGAYELKVESPGFQIQYVRPVVVGPVPPLTRTDSPFISVVLPVGTVAESVVVKAKAPPNLPAKSQNPVTPTRIRVGGNVEAAKLITSRKPEYPEEARVKGIEGTVVLDAVISVEGAPLSLKVISSPDPTLTDAAAKAVREWRYKPTLLNGEPIEVVTTITVRFELER